MVLSDSQFTTRLARDAADLHAAQHLRYQVFVEELGGGGALVDHAAQLEKDAFDPHAEHLLLINHCDTVVGTYRFMERAAAERAGGFYAEGEFDLGGLKNSGRKLLELGRSCVAAPYRGGMALYHLWHGLAQIALARDVDVLFGTASFHGTDPSQYAQALSYLHHHHLAPAPLRPRALGGAGFTPLPLQEIDRRAAMLATPPLIKSYLRLGGTLGEGIFIDHDFNTLDVLLLLDIRQMTDRQRAAYARGPAA